MDTNAEVAPEKKNAPAAAPAAAKPLSPFAVLFDLEGLAHGRRAAFDVLKSILGDHNVKFDVPGFSRYCLHPAPAQYLPRLLDALGVKLSASKLAEDVNSGVAMHLSSNTGALRTGVAALLDAARDRGMAIAALSALPKSSADSVGKKLGLQKWDVKIFGADDEGDDHHPRTDAWLKIAKSLEKSPRRCLVIASDKALCRAALSAGMSCVVVPDEFSAFQDFGGADMVLDALDDVPPAELLETLCPVDS